MFNGSGLDPEKVQLLLTIFIIILTANGTTQYKSGESVKLFCLLTDQSFCVKVLFTITLYCLILIVT